MDSTSLRLIRRARARRSHERHARAARTKMKQEDKRKGEYSTIPSLPSLGTSQYLTTRRAIRPDAPEGCVSDTNMPSICQREKGGHFSDTALTMHRHKRPRCHPLPEIPPLPTMSRMVREKTERLNLSKSMLQEIKDMNSHLHIVNWLWESRRVPPGSSNLVVVRRNSNNWFDMPECQPCARESPLSVNSELKSDYEEELAGLV